MNKKLIAALIAAASAPLVGQVLLNRQSRFARKTLEQITTDHSSFERQLDGWKEELDQAEKNLRILEKAVDNLEAIAPTKK